MHMKMLEHATLLRHLANLQNRVSQQVGELVDARANACQQLSEAKRCCADLERQLVRERGRQVAQRTAWLWGLLDAWMAATTPRAVYEAAAEASQWQESAPCSVTAFDLLCQTGCQGHAHAWQSDDGVCQITGNDCTRLTGGSAAPQQATSAEPVAQRRRQRARLLSRQG